MKIFVKRILLASVQLMLVCGFLFSSVMLNSCSEEDTELSVGANGFKIIGTSTDSKDGSAKVSCNGRAQSLSLVFNVADSYSITTDGSEWISIESGAEGVAGASRGVKFKVMTNAGEEIRTAAIYITIGANPRCKLATVTQTITMMDAIVKWVDERLSGEYYWLDKYNELKQKGEIDYDLTGSAFLKAALTGNKWGTGKKKVNKDDGYAYTDANGKPAWHLFSYLREYAATKAAPEPETTVGFGIELYTTLISHENDSYYDAIIDHVYPSSPAYNKGFKRGDIIKQINGQYIDSKNYETLCNMLQLSSTQSITVGKSEGEGEDKQIVTYALELGKFHQSPIAYYGVLEESIEHGFDFQGKKIGYISYLMFDNAYDTHLINAMKEFSEAGVTDMIVDLRSNGGGAVYTSSYFASMLLPASYSGKDMVILKRHELNEEGDDHIKFVSEVKIKLDEKESMVIPLPNLDLQSVYFITSDGTASASEMLIMGLRAQGIEAKTVGKQTMGKDCGMDVTTVKYGSSYYEFAPITFMNIFPGYDVNFADGIPADVDFDIIKDQVQDEDWKEDLKWFPMPEEGAAWGNYLTDSALGEAVANILGGTIFPTASTQGRVFDTPRLKATRSTQSRGHETISFSTPKVQGMYLHSDKVVEIE